MKDLGSRDRARMQLVVDEHMKAVLSFMQRNVPTAKLIGIANALPQIAKLLWDVYPQENVRALSMNEKLPAASTPYETQPASTE